MSLHSNPGGSLTDQDNPWNIPTNPLKHPEMYPEPPKPSIDVGTRPATPRWEDFMTPVDPFTGKLRPGFAFRPETLPGYEQYEQLATGLGRTGWGEARQQQLMRGIGFQGQQLGRQAQRGIAGAMAGLGGRARGAAQMAQSAGIRDILSAYGQPLSTGIAQTADISMDDAALRQKALRGMVGLGTSARQANIQSRLADRSGRIAFELERYKADLAEQLSADKAADILAGL